ncbi:MAG: glycosyl transferase [Campylobacterales bacterium]|nr:glycosyl transferase [Campylobacterales bacterium]
MGDFFQNGTITTLQDFGERRYEDLEREMIELSKRRNMVLLLPALYSEFETPAMDRIINELKEIPYLYKIVLGLDKATKEQFEDVKRRMSVIPTQVDVLWNDGPNMEQMYNEVLDAGFSSIHIRGKGRNVWMCLGYILADPDAYAIAIHDCDIVDYKKDMVGKLFYSVVHPALDFEFNKGYYARVNQGLNGRATRLFYTPLIRSLEKVIGDNKYLDYMDSFRYSLSGEFAFIRSLARGIRVSPTWGLEVSTLSEVYDHTSIHRICQTEIADSYEHKHQELSTSEANQGISKMSNDIAQTIFRILSQQGIVFSEATFKSLISTYVNEAIKIITKYNAVSKINGLEYNRGKEIAAVESFAKVLNRSYKEFLNDPLGVPSLSSWVTVRGVIPDFGEKLVEAVEKDNHT